LIRATASTRRPRRISSRSRSALRTTATVRRSSSTRPAKHWSRFAPARRSAVRSSATARPSRSRTAGSTRR